MKCDATNLCKMRATSNTVERVGFPMISEKHGCDAGAPVYRGEQYFIDLWTKFLKVVISSECSTNDLEQCKTPCVCDVERGEGSIAGVF